MDKKFTRAAEKLKEQAADAILGFEEETEQVRISIICDRCFTADFLRQLANAIEEDSVSETFETAHGCAEIDNPDSGDPKKTKTFAGLQIASAPGGGKRRRSIGAIYKP